MERTHYPDVREDVLVSCAAGDVGAHMLPTSLPVPLRLLAYTALAVAAGALMPWQHPCCHCVP